MIRRDHYHCHTRESTISAKQLLLKFLRDSRIISACGIENPFLKQSWTGPKTETGDPGSVYPQANELYSSLSAILGAVESTIRKHKRFRVAFIFTIDHALYTSYILLYICVSAHMYIRMYTCMWLSLYLSDALTLFLLFGGCRRC